ncbi:uncharacterized protein LOC142764776 isoform X1 [Rhipicephalus microplus]|uniref:uncharacterized protein LOC142764776 isoform X1 n=1 Tax=Rhipicephalus microplus TaxID=6941 RepID=UPI003F6B8D48
MLGVSMGVLLLLSGANGDLNNCEPDPRDAIIYAKQLALAVKHFMKNCMGFMDCFKGRPAINLIIEFFGYGCNVTLECAKKLGTEDISKIVVCSRPILSSINRKTGRFTEEQLVCLEDVVDCAVKATPNVAVAKLLLAYFRRMLG